MDPGLASHFTGEMGSSPFISAHLSPLSTTFYPFYPQLSREFFACPTLRPLLAGWQRGVEQVEGWLSICGVEVGGTRPVLPRQDTGTPKLKFSPGRSSRPKRSGVRTSAPLPDGGGVPYRRQIRWKSKRIHPGCVARSGSWAMVMCGMYSSGSLQASIHGSKSGAGGASVRLPAPAQGKQRH